MRTTVFFPPPITPNSSIRDKVRDYTGQFPFAKIADIDGYVAQTIARKRLCQRIPWGTAHDPMDLQAATSSSSSPLAFCSFSLQGFWRAWLSHPSPTTNRLYTPSYGSIQPVALSAARFTAR
ncbi:hypothetical protein HMPREF0322_02274 [Desulfitobacterium hafniense DP7]|uniref:Uncharacterized protein n=2 Tax=Desulfitobacterium hafniense TaxID=49338 RepID=Q24TU1_DESHY|nr:hypothetical protein [Desulfitobacterium hafniense]EHL07116.1 hypothetical protein HMPREF0322_02274 [Desulfitobacterium hafniense DP7]BAE84551.1 hypothetical protein DSY2762 [Desulfitobacterium hafniense Y51]